VKRAALCGLLALAALPAAAAPNGAAVFSTNCAFCHQAGAVGVPGQFPRLAGRIGEIAAVPDGRQFLLTVLLNGMSGHVTVDGQDILGLMPGFATLADGDLAAVLNYLARLGKPKTVPAPFTAKDFAEARTQPVLGPEEVALQRANLASAKIIP